MPLPPAVHTDRARAESFGSVAEQYDRFRPSYPDALIEDLVELAPDRVLDVGCGTGKVAVPLLACGLAVLGIEVDPQMAEIARRHGVIVEVAAFEDWDDAGRTFGMITCGQAWHWIEPRRGAEKAARLLEPGGTLALFWNYDDLDEGVQRSLDHVYATHAPELRPTPGTGRDQTPYLDSVRAAPFADVTTRRYAWTRTYTAEQWVGRAATHSDHIALPPERRTALLAALREEIERRGGTVEAHFGTYAILARTPGVTVDIDLLPLPDVATALDIPITRVHQLLRDGQLVAVMRPGGPRSVPALFVQDGAVVKSLPSVITQLRDAHFGDDEIVEWLFRPDESLPGSPIEALRRNHGTEVRRRAQVAGY